jgi:large subunit ribosomal protein L30e
MRLRPNQQEIIMGDLNNDLRLVIDTGKVTFGSREVSRAITAAKAKAVIVAAKGNKEIVSDLLHVCKIAGVRTISFNGNTLELGTLCGKPHSVNALAIIEPGNSGILNEEYS